MAILGTSARFHKNVMACLSEVNLGEDSCTVQKGGEVLDMIAIWDGVGVQDAIVTTRLSYVCGGGKIKNWKKDE